MPTSTLYKKLTPEIKRFIIETVAEALSDPDFGRELSDRAKKRLRQSLKYKGPTISLAEIKKKYRF